MKTSEILRKAWKRIEDPARWCQGALARDEEGAETTDILAAPRLCAEGALIAAHGGNWPDRKAVEYLGDAAKAQGCANFIKVNDRLGHDAVMSMYAHAIAAAEAQGD